MAHSHLIRAKKFIHLRSVGIGVPSSLNQSERRKGCFKYIDHLGQDSFLLFFALAPGCQEPMKPICQAVDFVHTFCGPCKHLVDRIGERFQGISEDHSESAVRREEKGLLRLSGWICQQMTSTRRGSMVSKVFSKALFLTLRQVRKHAMEKALNEACCAACFAYCIVLKGLRLVPFLLVFGKFHNSLFFVQGFICSKMCCFSCFRSFLQGSSCVSTVILCIAVQFVVAFQHVILARASQTSEKLETRRNMAEKLFFKRLNWWFEPPKPPTDSKPLLIPKSLGFNQPPLGRSVCRWLQL